MLNSARLDEAGGNAPIATAGKPVARQHRSKSSSRSRAGKVPDDMQVFVTHGHVDHYEQRLREHCDRLFPHRGQAVSR